VSNYGQLGFVNAESGCASDLAISQYSTGNLYNLANPTFTADAAKVGGAAPLDRLLFCRSCPCWWSDLSFSVATEQTCLVCALFARYTSQVPLYRIEHGVQGQLICCLLCRPPLRCRPFWSRSSTSWEATCMEQTDSRTSQGQLQTSLSGSRPSLDVRTYLVYQHVIACHTF